MNVLAYTSPARGHLFPLIPILRELHGRGHTISLRTLASGVDIGRGLGFATEAIDQRIEAIVHDDYQARTPVGSVKRSTAVFARRAEFEVEDLRAAIESESPDVVIVDINCWGAIAVAEVSGLPWVSFLPYLAPFPGKGVPPFGPGFAPAHNWVGRLRDRLLQPLVLGSVENAVKPPVNAVRRSVGAVTVAGARDLFASAPLTLYLTAEPFEYHRSDWPPSYRLVGPLSFDPAAEPPTWLDEIDKPIVLVTTSSEFQDDGRLVRTALEALRDEDVFVVATLPSGDPSSFQVPPNARVERWLAHSAVLPKAACVITHGGMGATQKALVAGVPAVVVPFGRDQLETARRVEVSGVGVRLPLSKLSTSRLREAVRLARTKRGAAQLLAAGFAAAGGAPRAADEIEALVAAR